MKAKILLSQILEKNNITYNQLHILLSPPRTLIGTMQAMALTLRLP